MFGIRKPRVSLPGRGRILYVALIVAGFFLIAFASRELIAVEREYSAARSEYKQLRELSPVISIHRSATQHPPSFQETETSAAQQASALDPSSVYDSESHTATYGNPASSVPDSIEEEQPDPMVILSEMNPDFIGWISIEDIIEYPVVRGSNNSRYLNRTFTGQTNSSGTIFMDYRHSQGFFDTVCILYGHNMRDGSMFAPLKKYTNRDFMDANPYITIATSEGELLTYRIFAARQTDAWNSAYELSFSDANEAARAFRGAPDGASNFLLLSTCTDSEDINDRLLVFAAR